MTNPTPSEASLTALASQVESASGPDRELDDAIAEALFTGKHRVCVKGLSGAAGGMWMFTYPNGSIGSSLRFTGSIDAARTLVPESHVVQLSDWEDDRLRKKGPWQAIVLPRGTRGRMQKFTFSNRCDHAAEPALALTAAALRALASNSGGEGS